MPENEIIEIQSQRYTIENCFRVLKTHFSSRLVYPWKRERILSHFPICYAALLLYRLLDTKLDKNGTHFTTAQIITTLKNMNVVDCEEINYKAFYTGSYVLDALEQIHPMLINRKHYEPLTLDEISKIIIRNIVPYNIKICKRNLKFS